MSDIILDADLANCAKAISFTQQELANYPDLLTTVELAVEEIFVNVASYAYEDHNLTQKANWGKIKLSINRVSLDDKPMIRIRICDWGKPFNPFLDAKAPDTSLDADQRPIGGLGIHLIKNIVNHRCYSDENNVNTIELFFTINITSK